VGGESLRLGFIVLRGAAAVTMLSPAEREAVAGMWRTIREPATLAHQPRRSQPLLWSLATAGGAPMISVVAGARRVAAPGPPD
jgi:hypothetical protein